jgi:DHA1 family multidrug resistance protein-like MFS transporter
VASEGRSSRASAGSEGGWHPSWRRNQIAVVAATFVGFTGFTLVMPFLPRYIQELGVTDTGEVALWAGITLGITPGIVALCAPLWGRVADRFGNKLLVQRSLLSCVVVMALMGTATEPWHLVALRAAQGLLAGYGSLTLTMAARSAPPEHMAAAIGAVQTAQRFGPAIGPAIGGVLASALGLRNAFYVSSLVYVVALVMVTVMYKARHDDVAPARTTVERVSFANVLAFENFLLLMLVIFAIQVVDRSFGPILLLHVSQIGYETGQAAVLVGALFSALALSGVVGHQLAAVLLRRTTARAVIVVALLAAAAALLAFALVESAVLLLLAISAFGAAGGTALTTSFTAAGSVVPRHAHGVGFGFLTGAALIGSAISPALSGLLAAHSINAVFLVGAAVLALLVLLVRRLMVARDLTVESAPAVEEA